MNDILELAKDYRSDIEKRAYAHEGSSEWHRKMGKRLGAGATALSAIVGTTIFATLAKQLEAGRIDLAPFESSWSLAIIGFVLILSPVVTGVQAYLRHPEQATTHKASSVGYCRLKHRLDIFCLRNTVDSSECSSRKQALDELDKISEDIEKVAGSSITLTKSAYKYAEKKLSGRELESGWGLWKRTWKKLWKKTNEV